MTNSFSRYKIRNMNRIRGELLISIFRARRVNDSHRIFSVEVSPSSYPNREQGSRRRVIEGYADETIKERFSTLALHSESSEKASKTHLTSDRIHIDDVFGIKDCVRMIELETVLMRESEIVILVNVLFSIDLRRTPNELVSLGCG